MAGSLVDLTVPGTDFPDPIVVDTNLLVERLIHPLLGITSSTTSPQSIWATQFFRRLNARNVTGIITPTVFKEVVHVAIQLRYKQELVNIGGTSSQVQRYGRPINNWKVLYQLDVGILHAFAADLRLLRQLLIANGFLIVGPRGNSVQVGGRTYDEELIHTVVTYGLDSNDAAILIEAVSCGVTDIVTMDPDMQRAQSDFAIYTWM